MIVKMLVEIRGSCHCHREQSMAIPAMKYEITMSAKNTQPNIYIAKDKSNCEVRRDTGRSEKFVVCKGNPCVPTYPAKKMGDDD